MRKIAGGKIYDTAKAKVVAEWANHYYRNDINYYEEILYRTAKGNWFIYREGESKYKEPAGADTGGGGEGITPLTADEAYIWLEEHHRFKEIEEYFQDRLEEA